MGPGFEGKNFEGIKGVYIRKLQIQQLSEKIIEFIGKRYPQDIVEKTIPLVQERIKKLSDYLPLCKFFVEKPCEYEIDLTDKKRILADTAKALQSLSTWSAKSIGDVMQKVQKSSGVKTGEFLRGGRVAIPGKKISPPLNESMEILGKDEVLTRLNSASM